jgi:DNA-binding GntR family transcriptional regulator
MLDDAGLPRLRTTPSLTDQTYEIIKDAIVTLRFSPGYRLSVHKLSDQLGVSRTPVKEAFQRLQQEGLVSVVPRKGTFVSPIEVKDIDEILEARALIEAFAATRAAADLTSQEFEAAEAVLEQQGEALEAGKIPESAEIGHGLHLIVLGHLANERMEAFLENMDVHYTRIRRIFSQEFNRQHQSLREHRGILECLKSRDMDRAYHAMFDHHLSVRDELVASFETGIREGTLDPRHPEAEEVLTA